MGCHKELTRRRGPGHAILSGVRVGASNDNAVGNRFAADTVRKQIDGGSRREKERTSASTGVGEGVWHYNEERGLLRSTTNRMRSMGQHEQCQAFTSLIGAEVWRRMNRSGMLCHGVRRAARSAWSRMHLALCVEEAECATVNRAEHGSRVNQGNVAEGGVCKQSECQNTDRVLQKKKNTQRSTHSLY